MENNNEIIENSEEVMETATEEIVKAASSNSSFSTATKFGLAMIAGGLICKFVVEPGVAKLKRKAEERAAKKSAFTDLYYYHLKSRSGIDLAISKALKEKKTFNETRWFNKSRGHSV